MDTYYNGSSMVDKGYADFTRSPKRSDPGNNPETVTMKTWLGGKDSQKRGMRTTTTFILKPRLSGGWQYYAVIPL